MRRLGRLFRVIQEEHVMNVPFTAEQFFDILRIYNVGVYPMQWVLLGLAIVAFGLQLMRSEVRHRMISSILAFYWVWMAVAYHLKYFVYINPAAKVFGALFLIEAVLLIWKGVIAGRLRFGYPGGARFYAGIILILYALAVYPLLGKLFGHEFPSSPTFGLPCPTTIFTIGIFCLTVESLSRLVLIVPIIWSAIGSIAAFRFGVFEDLGLLAAGIIAVLLLCVPLKRKHSSRVGSEIPGR